MERRQIRADSELTAAGRISTRRGVEIGLEAVSSTNASESADGAKAPITFPVLACLMIVDCLWRLFARGGPWPVTPWQYVSMGVDVLLLVGLVALWRSYPGRTPDAPPYVRWSGLLFGLGAAAGVIMLLLRFTSDHAWWTGRLRGGGF